MKKLLMFLKSKTVWGGIIYALPDLANTISTGVLGPKAAAVAQGAGIILAAVGIKGAINKSSPRPEG